MITLEVNKVWVLVEKKMKVSYALCMRELLRNIRRKWEEKSYGQVKKY